MKREVKGEWIWGAHHEWFNGAQTWGETHQMGILELGIRNRWFFCGGITNLSETLTNRGEMQREK